MNTTGRTIAEIAQAMQSLVRNEDFHVDADDLLIEALRAWERSASMASTKVAVDQLITAYEAIPKWYA